MDLRRNLNFTFLLIVYLAFGCSDTVDRNPLEIIYTINENDLVPEGNTYDPFDKSFYVSSTWKRKIIRIDTTGKATDFITEK